MKTSEKHFSQVSSFKGQSSVDGHWYFESRSEYTGFMPEQPTVDTSKNLIQKALSIMDISMRRCTISH